MRRTPEGAAREVADLFVRSARRAIAATGRFSAVLPGGSTPRPALRLLATSPRRERVDWAAVELFWGDERPVGPEHPDSNFGMARAELLASVEVPETQLHRIPAELGPEGAARVYQTLLATRAASLEANGRLFDLVLLGMGDDGHTASLFPGTDLYRRSLERRPGEWVVQGRVGAVGEARVSLTLAALESCRRAAFLVTGPGKAETVARVLGPTADRVLPAAQVRPAGRAPLWVLDADAASRLNRPPSG